jgi:hypothetical protein
MTTMNKKSAAFLAALDDNPQPAVAPRHVPSPGIAATADVTPEPQPAVKPTNSRTGLKHIGGYFDREDVEKVAVLRARLGLDNSQLIQLAVNDLYKKHSAQRAFGDAT